MHALQEATEAEVAAMRLKLQEVQKRLDAAIEEKNLFATALNEVTLAHSSAKVELDKLAQLSTVSITAPLTTLLSPAPTPSLSLFSSFSLFESLYQN
jgi:hypothetical protein